MFERNKPSADLTDISNELLTSGHKLVPEYVRRIAELVEVGSDNLSEGVGYHGTSLAALIIAMKTGHIPLGKSQGCSGHLYFFPLAEAELNTEGLRRLDLDPVKASKEAYKECAWYANDLSRAALGAALLGLDLESPTEWSIALNRDEILNGQYSKGAELLYQHGISTRELSRINRMLDSIDRGFVLVLGKSAVESFPYSLGDPGEGDLKLTPPPSGLPLEHIVGIEPLSEEDFDTIERLRDSCA